MEVLEFGYVADGSSSSSSSYPVGRLLLFSPTVQVLEVAVEVETLKNSPYKVYLSFLIVPSLLYIDS
jgi:hypothetical protein